MADKTARTILILGGARSGKSSFAVKLASGTGRKVLFCATAEPLDEEMHERIEQHKKSRPLHWSTLEASRNVAAAIEELNSSYDTVIIDCITLLLANYLSANDPSTQTVNAISGEIHDLITYLDKKQHTNIIVSNEVGGGLVPENKLARIYRDMLGSANQQLAAIADDVYVMVAGLPVKIK